MNSSYFLPFTDTAGEGSLEAREPALVTQKANLKQQDPTMDKGTRKKCTYAVYMYMYTLRLFMYCGRHIHAQCNLLLIVHT